MIARWIAAERARLPADAWPLCRRSFLFGVSLILRGDHKSRTNAALAEVFGFLFGRAA